MIPLLAIVAETERKVMTGRDEGVDDERLFAAIQIITSAEACASTKITEVQRETADEN